MKRAALTAAAVVAAVFIGRATVAAPPATHTERVIEHNSVEPRVVQATNSGLTADEVREIVRAEVGHTEPAQPAAPVDDGALAHAHGVLNSGLADGRWTTEDRELLNRELPSLSKAQFEEIISTLFAALPHMKVELEGPPL